MNSSKKAEPKKPTGLRVKTLVKAAGFSGNHNRTVMR
jgi:hypothetical protein